LASLAKAGCIGEKEKIAAAINKITIENLCILTPCLKVTICVNLISLIT
jgi:hypothetical protein